MLYDNLLNNTTLIRNPAVIVHGETEVRMEKYVDYKTEIVLSDEEIRDLVRHTLQAKMMKTFPQEDIEESIRHAFSLVPDMDIPREQWEKEHNYEHKPFLNITLICMVQLEGPLRGHAVLGPFEQFFRVKKAEKVF